MRRVLCVAVLVMAALSCHAQSKAQEKAPSNGTAHPALGDDFCKAGLRALRAIEGEKGSTNTTKPFEADSSETLATDIILSASVRAKTIDENKLSLLLSILSAKKQTSIMDQQQLRLMDKTSPGADKNIKQLNVNIIEGTKNQNVCDEALDTIFRSRDNNARSVAACLSKVE